MPRWRDWIPAAAVIAVAVGARLAWLAATNYTFEDAFITFQFAKRLAAGQGFVYNPGEPIYGTTTPLFALLLAGWLTAFPDAVVAGARFFAFLASAGGLALTWAVLSEAGVAALGRVSALALLAVSDKLWLFDTGGMETPLLFLFMMAALYAHLRGWPGRAGLAAGLLLLTRVDMVAWPLAIVLVSLRRTKRLPGRFVAATVLTYLPWAVFSALRFGSLIPHTIVAKWVHYRLGVAESLGRSAGALLAWMGPFGTHDVDTALQFALAGGTLLLALRGAREASAKPGLEVLWVFALLEAARIAVTGAAFEERYFVPVLSATLVLAGLGLAALAGAPSGGALPKAAWSVGAAVLCAASFLSAARGAPHHRDVQLYRHERALAEAGRWLDAHTPRGVSVLLEPLGYAGYFADRVMIDEVGLVSPRVVQIAREAFHGDSVEFSRVLLAKIRPDYFLVHCDDARRVFARPLPEPGAAAAWSRQAVFNPMAFDPAGAARGIARGSCYEIWAAARPDPGR